MESLNFPSVDLSKLNGDGRSVTMEMINDAYQNWGTFQLVSHGLSNELMDKLRKLTKEHDNLSKEQRFRQIMAEQGIDRAVEYENHNSDRKSTFFLSHLPDSNINTLPNLNICHYNYKATIEEFAIEVQKLAERILELLDENLGFEKSYLKRVFCGSKGPTIGSKVSNYPQFPNVELIKGLQAHSDPGGIILIFQDDEQVSGLRFLKGGHWVDVPLMKHSVVIILGDPIEVISNGKCKSEVHRLIARENENKMSIGSCYNPWDDALIFPFPGLILKEEENSSLVYPGFV